MVGVVAFEKALEILFPGRKGVTPFEERSVDLPATAAGYFDGFVGGDAMDPVARVFPHHQMMKSLSISCRSKDLQNILFRSHGRRSDH